MNEMVNIDEIKLSKKRNYIKNQEVHDSLLTTEPKDWPPILIIGNEVVDGYQRFMCAKENGIKQILCRRIK